MAYRVILTTDLRKQLQDAPPTLQGYVDGIVAVLRVEPLAICAAFETRRDGDVLTALFAAAQGFLNYRVLGRRQVVILLNVTWI